MTNLMIQHTKRIMTAAMLCGIILLTGCEQTEMERITTAGGDENVSGKLATLRISMQGIPEYNAPQGDTRTARSNEPLISEWVKVNSFDATRPVDTSGAAAGDDDDKSEGPRIALLELREDTVSNTPGTRSVMPAGVKFRLIAFRKFGNGYVFQSAADYTSNGSSAPVLVQGKMNLPLNQTYRFVAYSFNNGSALGSLPLSYTWGTTSINIPDLTNDFLTYDSGDQVLSGESFTLAVSFTHQLCQMTVRIIPTLFANNTFTNCTGVYVEQGGNSSSWVVGQDGIAANTSNSAPFNIPDNSTATVRLVPFASAREVSVRFTTLAVEGRHASYFSVAGSQKVQLTRGRSYTFTVHVAKKVGIQLSPIEMNLGGTNCTWQDKEDLSLLRWAEGNLKSTGDGSINDYVWTTPTDYGYYYRWMSTYTGNSSLNNTDPCTKLDPAKYGTGWRTPSKNELEKLSRCTDKQLVSNNGVKGMWFMNNPNGVFLTAAGGRSYVNGSGISPEYNSGKVGYYWSSDNSSQSGGFLLSFSSGALANDSDLRTYGFSVRCVRGNRQ